MIIFCIKQCSYFVSNNAHILYQKMLIFSIKQCSYFLSNNAHILHQTLLIFCIKQCSYFASNNAHILHQKMLTDFQLARNSGNLNANIEILSILKITAFIIFFLFFSIFIKSVRQSKQTFLIKINNLCFVLFIKSFAFFVSKHTNFFKIKAFQIF